MVNQEIAKILKEIADLLDIKGTAFKPRAYRKAALTLENLQIDIKEIFENQGIKGLKAVSGIGESIAEKIKEYLQKGKISYYEKLKKETGIRQVITHFFESKGVSLAELKTNAKKEKIVYSRFTRPAKQLIELAGSVETAKQAISKVAEWANSRGLDYAIETVFKKWLELDRLKPKEIVKKPFYEGNPMIWSESKKKWYVISPDGEWLEFADLESKMEWRIVR